MKRGWALAIICLLAAASPARPPALLAESVPRLAQTAPSYRLGPGDRLRITVYGEEKFSGEFAIGGDGQLLYPLVGALPVAGLTVQQLIKGLTAALTNGYLQHPSVTAEVLAYRPVFILGEVEKPGQYPYAENMTIYGLVAQAGGFTYRGNRRLAKVRHDGEAGDSKYRISSSSPVRPGDTIRILERFS